MPDRAAGFRLERRGRMWEAAASNKDSVMADGVSGEVLRLTAKIVSAHIGNNQVTAEGLPELIQSIYRSLAMAGVAEAPAEPLTPAVPIKKSVFPDYIICLEDGKKLKMLKRHLHTRYGMTPNAYRTKWGLPDDYPMVCPSYASQRSTMAKMIGLGRKASNDTGPAVTQLPARQARGSKG